MHDQMRVSWTSSQNATQGAPRVEWGETADNLTHVVKANTATYTAEELCGAPGKTIGWHQPGQLRTTFIAGLPLNKQFFYSVLDDSEGSGSAVYSFFTQPHIAVHIDVDFFLFGSFPNPARALSRLFLAGADSSNSSFDAHILLRVAFLRLCVAGDLGQMETDGNREADQDAPFTHHYGASGNRRGSDIDFFIVGSLPQSSSARCVTRLLHVQFLRGTLSTLTIFSLSLSLSLWEGMGLRGESAACRTSIDSYRRMERRMNFDGSIS